MSQCSLRRLIDLIAEDNAIEDTIYHLHRALNGGRIDLERFLRVHFPYDRMRLLNLISDYSYASRRAIHEAGADREDSGRDSDGPLDMTYVFCTSRCFCCLELLSIYNLCTELFKAGGRRELIVWRWLHIYRIFDDKLCKTRGTSWVP
jgi:Vps23 core domain